jgi:hypothetical protein
MHLGVITLLGFIEFMGWIGFFKTVKRLAEARLIIELVAFPIIFGMGGER